MRIVILVVGPLLIALGLFWLGQSAVLEGLFWPESITDRSRRSPLKVIRDRVEPAASPGNPKAAVLRNDAICHEETHAPQHLSPLFDHLNLVKSKRA